MFLHRIPFGRLNHTFSAFAFFYCVANTQSFAQQQVEHAAVIDARANEPIRVFSMWLPFRTVPVSKKHEITMDAHSGNAWNPSGVIEYPDPGEDYGWDDPSYDYQPRYEEAPHRYQFYSADGVIRNTSFTYTRKVSDHAEIYGAINVNRLVGGESIIDWSVSDATIEVFHEMVMGKHDPYRRLQNPLDKAQIKFTDREGRTLNVQPHRLHVGTIDAGYRGFVDLVRAGETLWTVSGTAQIGIPVNAARSHIAAGILLGSAFTRRCTERYSITAALGYSVQHDKMLRVFQEHLQFNYANVVTSYRFVIGQQIDFKKKGLLTIGIELQGMSAPLKRKGAAAPHLNPEDIGITTDYAPEYWTVADPIPMTNQRRAARALLRGSGYQTLTVSYAFGPSPHTYNIGVYVMEDFNMLYDPQGVFPVFKKSNNAQDFGTGIRLSKSF